MGELTGESQVLQFTISASDISSFNTSESAFIAEAGDYIIKFGNAEQTTVSGKFNLAKNIVVEKVNKVLVPKTAINELRSH